MRIRRSRLQASVSAIDDWEVGVIGALAALLLLGVLYQRLGARRQRRRFPPPGLLMDVGGHRLHVRCLGHGSPVVVFESGLRRIIQPWHTSA